MIRILRTIYDHNGKTYKAGTIISETVFKARLLDRLFKSKAVEYVELKPTQEFKGDIKPVIVTGMWKRPEVFKIFGQHYKDLGIDVIVAGSEGKESEKLAKKYGFHYIEIENQPLATKMNATTLKAKELGYTHVICVGSDDLLSKELIDEYLKLMRKGYDYIGVTDFYFYEMESSKAAYWGGYRDRQRLGHTAGAGRVISRTLLDEWDWKPWDDKDSKYLDNSMQTKLRSSLHPKTTFSLKEKGLLAVDIKSQVNMTPFELWDNTSYIDPKLITDNFNVRNSGNN
jgi:hypothetical protein